MKLQKLRNQFGTIAAVVTWAIVFGICLYWMPQAPESIQAQSGFIAALFVTYIVCFLTIVWRLVQLEQAFLFYLILAIQLLSAFGLMLLIPLNFLPILTVIWVSMLPHVMRLSWSIAVMIIVVSCWFVLYQLRWEQEGLIFSALLYATFHLFAILMIFETVKAERAKAETDRLNQELKAAQHLLSEASKQSERTRIARELHDLLGHHLTALSINLQVASHMTDGEAKDKIEQCQFLAKLLLSDVREAVNTLREHQDLDFEQLLNIMAEQVPNLTIERDLQFKFSLDDMHIAKVFLNCIQEALTNSMRHSGASQFNIQMFKQQHMLHLTLRDNGKVASNWSIGNGLRGMQERLEAVNGDIKMSDKNRGLALNITVPLNSNDEPSVV